METSEAVVTGFEYSLRMKQDEEISDLVDLETYPMVGESLFHLLYVIESEKMGNSLAGSTFINLVPQALPEFWMGSCGSGPSTTIGRSRSRPVVPFSPLPTLTGTGVWESWPFSYCSFRQYPFILISTYKKTTP